MNKFIKISNRKIGIDYKPFVIAEIGINHEGSVKKAIRMIDDAYKAGCECVKFQSHVVEDEMIPEAKNVIPSHTKESIYEIMERCAFSEKDEKFIKKYIEKKGMIYLCTPFSRAAADRLEKMNVKAYKIGSGECNNYPLIEHIAKFKKPVILSTGMNDINSIKIAVSIFRKYKTPFALLHCTSMYPSPYEKVRLGALEDLKSNFPNVPIGLSDHSLGIYTSLGAIALGACIVEKHFTSDLTWKGPDIPISITPEQLKELIFGSEAIYKALGGKKNILKEEQDTIDFAYACVVSTKKIRKGEEFTKINTWVKRPGTGQIKAIFFKDVLGKKALRDISKDVQIKWSDFQNNSSKSNIKKNNRLFF